MYYTCHIVQTRNSRPSSSRLLYLLSILLLSSLLLPLFVLNSSSLLPPESISQLTPRATLPLGLALPAHLAVPHHQDMQRIFTLIRHRNLEMRLRLLAIRLGPRHPAQQLRDAEDVRVDGEAVAAETEQHDARRGLGADALERQQRGEGGLRVRVVQVVQAVGAVLVVHLRQDLEDHARLDDGEAAAADRRD